MEINYYYAPYVDANSLFEAILVDEFKIQLDFAQDYIKFKINPLLEKLKDSCFFVAETEYVDKVYRDSYYNYYASKLNLYQRNTVRISIFSGEVREDEFRKRDKKTELEKKYWGYFILRPIGEQILGRNVISPSAFRSNDFSYCSSKFPTTVNNIKFTAEGFPHSSQDGETITCAETCIWTIMEYFSNKYPDYHTVLPSRIIKALEKVSFERQIPSKGLEIESISYAMKEFGFGTRIYSRSGYSDLTFEKIFNCYVESGIPVIVGIDNLNVDEEDIDQIAHAVICIGHTNISATQIIALPANNFDDEYILGEIKSKQLQIYDWNDLNENFVFVDDNLPAYQTANICEPAKHYNDSSWSKCIVNHLIVPLYPKIYLDAYEAKNFAIRALLTGLLPLNNKQELLVRFYLTSSRSYRDHIALQENYPPELKDILLGNTLAKFIWVMELSTKDMIINNLAQGLIILDATEADTSNYKPLILGAFNGVRIQPDTITRKLTPKYVTLHPFLVYNNLKTN